MSRILSVSCMLLFFFLLLLFPSAAADGASAGILLWYRKILPVLLPFTLASRLMEASNIISFLPPAVGMAVLGWCCGYPMGAICASILVRNGKLTCRQGELLLPLCSQPSPMFLVGYLRTQAGGLEPLPLLAAAYLPPLLILLPLLCIYGKESNGKTEKTAGDLHILRIRDCENCWFASCRILLKIGAYVLVFSILIAILHPFLSEIPQVQPLLAGVLEMTTGIGLLADSGLPSPLRGSLGLFLVCFGGCSCIAQTLACLEDSPLTGKYFWKGKLFLASVSATFYYICQGGISFLL